MTIVKKVTIVLLLFSMIPLSYISYQFYSNTTENLQDKILSDLKGQSERQKNRLILRFEQKEERLNSIVRRNSIIRSLDTYNRTGLNQKELNDVLFDAEEANEHFKEISTVNVSGRVVGSSNPEVIGRDYSRNSVFIKGKEMNDLTSVFKEADGNIYSYLAGPIKDKERTIGVLLIKTDNDTILSLVQDYSGLGETGEIILVKKNENGDALAISPLRFKQDAAFSSYWSSKDSSFPANEVIRGTSSVYKDVKDYRGKNVLAATQYMEDIGWGMIIKIDQDEAFAPLNNLRNILLLQLLGIIVIIFFLSRYIAEFLTKPILNLKETSEKLSQGDLTARANVYNDDELGQLSKTFNQMANDIEISFNMLKDKTREAKDLKDKLEVPSPVDEIEKVEKEIKDIKKKLI